MGDSFSAGPFIGTMRTDPEACARSRDNYPAFLADWLDVASYTDVTCSAATTADLYAPMTLFDRRHRRAADRRRLRRHRPGDDRHRRQRLRDLRRPDPVPAARRRLPRGALRTDARKVAGGIEQAVRRIAKVAPDAQVYVVGYPDILPTEGTCAAVGASAEVLGPVTEVAGLLNASLRRGAEAGGRVVRRHGGGVGRPRRLRQGPGLGQRAALPGRHRGALPPEDQRHAGGRHRGVPPGHRRDPEVTEYAEPDPDVVVLNQP